MIEKKHIILFSIFFCFSILYSKEAPDNLRKKLVSYFADQCEVEKSDVDLKILHISDKHKKDIEQYDIKIKNKGERLIGHKSLWIKAYYNNSMAKKFPMTVNVSVRSKVLVAKNTIKYESRLDTSNVEVKEKEIRRNYSDYYRSMREIPDNYVSQQVIRKGEPIKGSLLREKNVIERGETIKVDILSGNIRINTEARARENGSIGEQIDVYIQKTRERMEGKVKKPGLVEIKIGD